MQNTQRMLLMLSALLVMPAYGAINLNQVEAQIGNVVAQVQQYRPQAEQLIQGNFNILRPQLRSLDLRPFIGDVQKYLAVIKANLPTILNQVPVNSVPAEYRGYVNDAIKAIKSNMDYFDTASALLNKPEVRQYFNIGAYSDSIIDGLNSVKNSPEYINTVKPALEAYYNDQLKKAFDGLDSYDKEAITRAFDFIKKKINGTKTDVSLDNINDIAITFGVIRKLITVVSGLSDVALSIDSAITQSKLHLPSQVHDALSYVHDNADKIEQQLNTIAKKLQAAASGLLQ